MSGWPADFHAALPQVERRPIVIGAHELGNDYVWDDYEDARQAGNTRGLQELELRCDGFAVITMAGLRVNPEQLASAAIKLARYNERMFGKPIDPRTRVHVRRSRTAAT